MKKNKELYDLKEIYRSLYAYEQGEEKKHIYNDYLYSLRKLAYNGNVESQYELAQHYEDMGVMGWPNPYHNPKKCFYWYSKAANNNHAAANNNLANMYETGEGCTQNIKKALELYKKSAELGDFCGKKNYKLLLKQIKEGKYKLE